MNLRNIEGYNIGLDIGTASVGWAVTDAEGELPHFKGKPTWGSRIFPGALPASEARAHRSLRRRYARRRWRLDLLQEIFAAEMEKADSGFFVRMNQSRLLPEDRAADHAGCQWTLFNDADFTERDYFKRFPTIYHLRAWLMDADEKADIRLIYLALHNIVKHRGNFLQQENGNLSSGNANVKESVEELCRLLQEYCDDAGIVCAAEENAASITCAISQEDASKAWMREEVQKLLGIQASGPLEKAAAKAFAKAVAGAILGYKADLAQVLFVHDEAPADAVTSIYLSNDENVEAFQDICPDDVLPLFQAMLKVHSAIILQGILSSHPGQSLSVNKVAEYERYGEDLKLLKSLVRHYAPSSYDEFFRGAFYQATETHPQKHVYDKAKAKGYTLYNEVHSATSYEDLRKAVEKLLSGTAAVEDPRYQKMMDGFKEERFLRRLKTSDNGAIPFQLHLEEMKRIIQNQARFYPFLAEEEEKLRSLVTFRIPYYVGPLTLKNARTDASGKMRFAWAQRRKGMESEPIKPWNWESVIDKDRSATEFIQRMTGTCTYLQGEPVLPKCSLLYEEFCVLNELNGAHFTQDGDTDHRFDYADRSDMMEDLFKHGRVTYKKVSDWMRQRGHSNVHVSGGQGENGFESKLGSYIFFAKDIFGVDEIPEADYPMIEEIILWSTLFEDRAIFKEKLERNYGDRLTPEQIKRIVRKRFTGWGRLSRKMLTGVKVATDEGDRSLMDVLREGNPNHSGHSFGRAMVLMEALRDEDLGLQRKIDAINKDRMLDAGGLALEELPGSPALRRSINQALCIVEEIVRIAGHEPDNIFIEVTRDEDERKKGKRTKRRYESLMEGLAALKKEAPDLWSKDVADDLASRMKAKADLDERLTLYFMQGGKSLYSGKPIDVNRLSSGDYHVDHIIPQSYIKDDSFENKALVLASENEAKSDQMLIDASIRKKMAPYWKALHEAKLIGDKKYRNLMRDHIGEKQMKGFIARQLVETSQIMKLVQMMLRERYAQTEVVPVKAALSSELRKRLELPKCRELNDFHHAHDAFLAAEVGRFIQKRHPGMYDNPIGYAKVMKAYVKNESERVRRGAVPGTSSFVIASFLSPGFDEETGEIKQDDWNPSSEAAKIKRYFNYRQCFISRMPEEGSGAFWGETIYSPRGGVKNPTVPLKKDLEVEKYGGYAVTNPAYFVLFIARDGKGRLKRLFEGMAITDACLINANEKTIEEWAESVCEEKGLEFERILRRRMLKYTRIEYAGDEFYVPALDCVYSSRELVLSQQLTRVASLACNQENVHDEEIDDNDLLTLYAELASKCLILCSRFKSVHDCLVNSDEEFMSLNRSDKRKVISNLLRFFNGATTRVDLTLVGGAKNAGKISNGFLVNAKEDFTIIDQSITGMFEKRTHIGL